MTERSTYRPTERFTTKAETYAKIRPWYPKRLLDELNSKGALKPGDVVADVGSGTGLLSMIFVDYGHLVVGIEPNTSMRTEAERRFIGVNNFVSIDAKAEDTTIPSASVDLIVVGQAFHWFELEPTRKEFQRILRDDGAVAIIWNERQDQSQGFLADYDVLLDRHCATHGQTSRMNVDQKVIESFFTPGRMEKFTLPNFQDVDLEGVKGRLISSSYAPDPGQPGYEEIINDLTTIFDRYQVDGKVRFSYDTEVYLGRFVP